MKAGDSNIEVGTEVVIKGITGEDKELNGLTGKVTHPFGFGKSSKGWVGIYLDDDKRLSPYGDKFNIKETECKKI